MKATLSPAPTRQTPALWQPERWLGWRNKAICLLWKASTAVPSELFERQFELPLCRAFMKQTTNSSAVNCENEDGTVHAHLGSHWFNTKCIHMTWMNSPHAQSKTEGGCKWRVGVFFFFPDPVNSSPTANCWLLFGTAIASTLLTSTQPKTTKKCVISLHSLSIQQSYVVDTEKFTEISMSQVGFKYYIAKVHVSGMRRRTQNRKCYKIHHVMPTGKQYRKPSSIHAP